LESSERAEKCSHEQGAFGGAHLFSESEQRASVSTVDERENGEVSLESMIAMPHQKRIFTVWRPSLCAETTETSVSFVLCNRIARTSVILTESSLFSSPSLVVRRARKSATTAGRRSFAALSPHAIFFCFFSLSLNNENTRTGSPFCRSHGGSGSSVARFRASRPRPGRRSSSSFA